MIVASNIKYFGTGMSNRPTATRSPGQWGMNSEVSGAAAREWVDRGL